ncbi:GntR family transcriptional regulator [Bacillus oleivorans]|nr:GntR family transcriptional regulator [Bacillus oleivorans]
MPSENQLMNEYSVSRNTAKKAIEELVVTVK